MRLLRLGSFDVGVETFLDGLTELLQPNSGMLLPVIPAPGATETLTESETEELCDIHRADACEDEANGLVGDGWTAEVNRGSYQGHTKLGSGNLGVFEGWVGICGYIESGV